MDVSKPLSKKRVASIAVVVGGIVALIKYVLEGRLSETVVDPQMGLFSLYSLISSIAIGVLLAAAIYLAVRTWQNHYSWVAAAFTVVALALVGFSVKTTVDTLQINTALLDAANPDTPTERLRELAQSHLNVGYELQNRLAKNPNTPADVLQALFTENTAMSTRLILASNPNTPNSVLISLSESHPRKWHDRVIAALKSNPKVQSNELSFTPSMTLQENKDGKV
ncbi:hypothetical protein CWI84_07005 [Idiomarina tyrosinivorans]|uniref:Uncharacterized protein n=1 Tax=Idiomarina tyrosinivorans TaxID=1445662 RepID=A0A432ZR90_9GAMM|nr:hypothetical protein [Idiomarina tyrosinivorans]RUO80372.1 hypothetical protein CWI84_07005 [Idiomarina tyrosinivorans]